MCLTLSSRPLEDELSAVMSEPKRPVLESSITSQAPNVHNESPSPSLRGPAAVSQTPHGSAADLFAAQSTEEPRSRKRKETEGEIQIEELESIMSLDMDCLDEQTSDDQGQKAQPMQRSAAKQKQGLNSEEALSSSKRQRLHVEENGTSIKTAHMSLEKESGLPKKPQPEQRHVSIKTEQVCPTDVMTSDYESSKHPKKSSASTSKAITPFEEDEGSFIEVRK